MIGPGLAFPSIQVGGPLIMNGVKALKSLGFAKLVTLSNNHYDSADCTNIEALNIEFK